MAGRPGARGADPDFAFIVARQRVSPCNPYCPQQESEV